ncbi:ATP-dependent nuclease [Hymenobacter sp. IS2118]|uniref:ATP-dependent nuclease n=1 Tax=Hymenobacter sp. IS2118 TaxID=1505605 RepID=UPI000557DE17|nr:AAA family ATPase [Hymenobacter sp. IS2118]
MKLLQFRVENFKSIKDSGWVQVGQLSCILGTNEAGKTNLLQGLWKLNPANDEPIVPLSDYPRKKYASYEATEGAEEFITADFELTGPQAAKTAESGAPFSIVRFSRLYHGKYRCWGLNSQSVAVRAISGDEFQIYFKQIPHFVYFSDYGNLDSEIYLPHVIENSKRTDLGEGQRAKARSLDVLFKYVQLKPKEILELGQETPTQQLNHYGQAVQAQPTAEQIDADRAKKKKREILLTSASSQLTQAFREWWKQGDYRFRFQADGNHFRIWVSDDRRHEEVELEGRSRGLQWFFSFFLVFLVEAKNSHHNSILLLDEPGLSLHPLAQADLIKFFASLSEENQLIYTTHSPFLVEPNNLANIKAVYVDDAGQSTVSSNLRQGSKVAEHSIYPVHAAIGLTVSQGLLLGCQPVLVEGPSDQIYLQLIKNLLSGQNKYRHDRDLVFVPTGGVSGMKPIISILAGRDNALPYAVLDSDKPGRDKENQLKGGLYKDEKNKVIGIAQILGAADYEIEDLIPADELARVFSKAYRGKQTDDFDDLVDAAKPLIPQMEAFAEQNGYELETGWKVELARDVQKASARIASKVTPERIKLWKKLFDKLTS